MGERRSGRKKIRKGREEDGAHQKDEEREITSGSNFLKRVFEKKRLEKQKSGGGGKKEGGKKWYIEVH